MKLEWEQPDESQHIYIAACDAGNYLVKNIGPAIWEATFEGETISEKGSRREVMEACYEHANPQALAITINEFLILQEMSRRSSKTITISEIVTDDLLSNYSTSSIMRMITRMADKGLIDLEDDELQMNRVSEQSYEVYELKDPRKTRKGTTRRNPAVSKFGERPEDVGPRPTVVEWCESRLHLAQARLAFVLIDRCVHPYSPKAISKITNAEKEVEENKAKLDSAREIERIAVEKGLPAPLKGAN